MLYLLATSIALISVVIPYLFLTLTSAPAELEFSVDIMSNKAFFPSDSWTLDGVTYSLFELKQAYGVEFKYFVADWGDGDINAGGTSGGFVDEYQSIIATHSTISRMNTVK